MFNLISLTEEKHQSIRTESANEIDKHIQSH